VSLYFFTIRDSERRVRDYPYGTNYRTSCARSNVSVQYKQYTVQAFERELGKWRASVRRSDGRLLWKGRARIRSFVTGIDATTPQRALQMALAAIDRGAFSRQPVDRRMHGHRHRNAS